MSGLFVLILSALIIVNYLQVRSADPLSTVRRIYDHFGLKAAPAFWEETQAAAARSRAFRSAHHYHLEDYGLSEAKLRSALPEVYRVLEASDLPSSPQLPESQP